MKTLLALPLLALFAFSCRQREISPETGIPVSAASLKKIGNKLQEISGKGFEYPWTGIEEQLRAQGLEYLPLVGYGSLLNPQSAARTITNTPPDGHPPVIAAGARRVFEYRMPDKPSIDPADPARAALNVRATGRPSDLINGRLLTVHFEDLPALRKREFGYSLRPVVYLPWGEWKNEPSIAYILCAEREVVDGTKILDPSLLPEPSYLELCEAGARMVSPDFHRFFLQTTYLANGQTSLDVWKQTHARAGAQPSTKTEASPEP